MAQVTITINAREYAIACDDGQEGHIIKLARMLDEKAKLLTSGGAHINENMLLAMVGLLLADELAEARKSTPVANQTMPHDAPQVVVQTVERVVEKIVEPDLSSVDEELALVLQGVAEQIKSVANEIEKM